MQQVDEVLMEVEDSGNLIILGDWDAVIAKSKEGDTLGEYEFGKSIFSGIGTVASLRTFVKLTISPLLITSSSNPK